MEINPEISFEDIRNILDKFGYKGNQLLKLHIEDVTSPAYAIEVKAGQKMTLWSIFRGLVVTTRKWPLLSMIYPDGGSTFEEQIIADNFFMRSPYKEGARISDIDITPSRIIDRSKQVSNQSLIDSYEHLYSYDFEDTIEMELERTFTNFRTSPKKEDMLRYLDGDKNIIKLEKWLLDWELRYFPDSVTPTHTSYFDWFEPSTNNEEEVLFLIPTEDSENILAFIHWYGSYRERGSELAISQLKVWREKYGAELVAHHCTMLNLKIQTRPKEIDEAFDLAVEQAALAPDILMLPGVSIREHARTLLKVDRWFLHSKP